ncbi:MAG: glutamate--tRNA ligase [Clostridia bacterium]|nr:glutamate--tRNA ligase [Bacillota bacterium]MBO2521057.1 glutamate--tRNA ligase [Bacillota bacterium]
MDDRRVRVRFAPSPTGALHVGSARTALFNWLFARHTGGVFVLRIEDTDALRSTESSAEGILQGLRWLGLDWDEGPGAGGDYGPYYQRQRLELYREFARRLEERGRAYRCYCTPEELDARRQQMMAEGKGSKYDRRCLHLTGAERRRFEDEGRPYVLRFLCQDEGETVVHDLIRGDVRFPNQVLDDFVIVRSDGMPTYNFAAVVDDHLMAITHVIRGEDHLSNTPKQIQVYQALDLPVPQFAHIPMILGPDRSKLSKRHGAKFIMEFAEEGYLPEAMVNYLALLGWAYDDSQEIFEIPGELIEKFSLEGISKNPAIFDVQKLEWMNGVYIRKLDPAELARRALPTMQKAGLLPQEVSDALMERYRAVVKAVQERVKTLGEIVDRTRYFFAEEITWDPKAVKKFLHREYVPALFERLIMELSPLEPFTAAAIEPVFDRIVEESGLSRGDVMQPVRVAVTGGTVSPGMYETLELLGRARTCQRLRTVLERLRRGEL